MSNEELIHRPNVGPSQDIERRVAKSSGRVNIAIPENVRNLLIEFLREFRFEEKRVVDVVAHVLDADPNQALDDAVPMKSFFGMVANNFEMREEIQKEKIDIYLSSGVKDSSKRITDQKSSLKSSPNYLQMVITRHWYAKMKRNARTLEEAMKMRLGMAQTKSANKRGVAPQDNY